MLKLTFSSKLDWGSYIISIAKSASKKIWALIRSMKFLSPEVALYLYKSMIRPCMECCCHVWAGAPSCYLELLDKLQKRICKTVGPSLAAALKPLAHRRNIASLSLTELVWKMVNTWTKKKLCYHLSKIGVFGFLISWIFRKKNRNKKKLIFGQFSLFCFTFHANLMSDGKKKRLEFLFLTSIILLINMSISFFRWTV